MAWPDFRSRTDAHRASLIGANPRAAPEGTPTSEEVGVTRTAGAAARARRVTRKRVRRVSADASLAGARLLTEVSGGSMASELDSSDELSA